MKILSLSVNVCARIFGFACFATVLETCFLLQNSLVLRHLISFEAVKHGAYWYGVLQNPVSFAKTDSVGVAKLWCLPVTFVFGEHCVVVIVEFVVEFISYSWPLNFCSQRRGVQLQRFMLRVPELRGACSGLRLSGGCGGFRSRISAAGC